MSIRQSLKKLSFASAIIALAGCSTAELPNEPVAPSADLGGLLGGVTGTVTNLAGLILLQCTPQPYVKVTQTVGPSGGTIVFGAHKLVIPPGALSQSVAITAEAMPEAGNAVRFRPEGLRFAVNAPLTLSYANCKDDLLKVKLIVYTNDFLKILELLKSINNQPAKQVTTGLEHFSRYAVAW